MDLTTDQVNQIISIISGLLTIVVGALVRHYLPPRDRREDGDEGEDFTRPRLSPPPATPPTPSKEAPTADE